MSQAVATLKTVYGPIQPEMDRVEEVLRRELEHENPFVGQLLDHSQRFQGKRVRPALLLHSAHLLGEVTDLHVALGAVVEILHGATLVHDDVLDEALLRRQVQTLNRGWGNEAAVLLGDYLFAKAYTLCARLHHREANLILARTVEDMCVGELSQIALKFNFDLSEEQYYEVIRRKTSSLFATACRLGGVGSGADPRHVEALARFGSGVGTAFQIVDDCLDLVGEEDEVGKSLGTDLEKGKLTLPVLKLLRQLPPSERRALEQLLCTPGADQRRTVVRLLQKHGLVAWSLQRAAEIAKEAKSHLREVGDSPHVTCLHTLADFVLQRRA